MEDRNFVHNKANLNSRKYRIQIGQHFPQEERFFSSIWKRYRPSCRCKSRIHIYIYIYSFIYTYIYDVTRDRE